MAEKELTLDQVRRMAEELLRATNAARARRAALKTGELQVADEPAHVFRAEDKR